jgi:16S rRNA processing protein RimM
MNKDDKLEIAKIGKAVGLAGEVKLHLHTDFIEQFKEGANFFLNDGTTIKIESYNPNRSLVKFYNYNVREDASKLTNKNLFVTIENTREVCELDDGEYFWFDVIGSSVVDDGEVLGEVKDIERIAEADYLSVKTSTKFVGLDLPIKFLIPYVDRYVKEFDKDAKKIITMDALGLLEAS